MKRLRIVIVSAMMIAVIVIVSCLATKDENNGSDQPKNIILLIGDGMGVAQITAALTVAGSPMHIESLPVGGLTLTSSYDRYITDSGAAGTAIATGVKTRNGVIGMNHDSIPVPNITEIASENGLATGILSTSSVTHATPAAFVAHVISRNNQEDIAAFFLDGSVDVFMGGGLRFFNDRRDGLNLVDSLNSKGFEVVTSPEELAMISKGKVAGLFYDNHMPAAGEGRSISLAEMTKKAIEILSENEKGFFLMVEGSMIDWAGHDNDTEYMLQETRDFDEAVGEALAFAAADGNTLVIATADHETGGMTLTGGNLNERIVTASWSTTGHTAAMVPVFAYGAGAEKFGGIMENTELFERMIMGLGIK
jgi:alkaline phosphatase